MSMMMTRPESSELLLPLSAALNEFVNSFDLAPERNIVVHCFDTTVDDWEQLPAAWHRPLDNDIVVNMGTLYKSLRERESAFRTTIFPTRDGRYEADESLLEQTARLVRAVSGTRPLGAVRYQTFTDDEGLQYNTRPVANTHRTLRTKLAVPGEDERRPAAHLQATLLAVLLHETGHATFSQYITEDWYADLTPYERKVMTMFEELRCERQQLARVGLGASLIRRAADVVVDPARIAADITAARDEGGDVSVPNLALNSTLCLGRTTYDVFLGREVSGLATLVSNTVGSDRYEQMFEIWNEFSSVRELDPAAMTAAVRRWVELFPSAQDGSRVHSSIGTVVDPPESGDDDTDESESETPSPGSVGGDDRDGDGTDEDESLDLPGLADEFADAVTRSAEDAERFPDDRNHEYGPADVQPSATSYAQAERATRASSTDVTTHLPHGEDRVSSKRLAHELRQLNVAARDRVQTTSATPPGRLRSRAMVQRAAERSQGRASTAEPWRRIRHVVHPNPGLTVGIMTDTSASQGWATEFSSRLAWILARAVSEINGRVAAVTFGDDVRIVQRPGEHAAKRTQVKANGDTELFDVGMGSLDAMLGLLTGTGIRIVFVCTDGELVQDAGLEMRKAAMWVERLTRAGCLVVWITPNHGWPAFGLPTTPEGAVPLSIKRREVETDPRPAIAQVGRIVKTALSQRQVG